MKVLCIAASNSRKDVEESVSFKVCRMAEAQIAEANQCYDYLTESISLKNFDLKVCTLCGACAETGLCHEDSAFNTLLEKMSLADRLLFVVPHYSPFPTKLMILFEKINEQSYAGWLKDPKFVSPVQGKSFGVIGHGGMTETSEVLAYYQEAIVKPIARTLKSLGLKHMPLPVGAENSNVFGLLNDDCLQQTEGAFFPNIVLDETRIAARIAPVVNALIG